MALTNLVTSLVLDVYDHDITPASVKAIALDKQTRFIKATLTYRGADYPVDENATVTLTIIRPDKTGVQVTGSVVDVDNADRTGTIKGVYAELSQAALAKSGTLKAQFKITSGEQILRTEIFLVKNGIALDGETSEWAEQYEGYNLDELVQSVNEMETDVTHLKSGLSDISGKTRNENTAHMGRWGYASSNGNIYARDTKYWGMDAPVPVTSGEGYMVSFGNISFPDTPTIQTVQYKSDGTYTGTAYVSTYNQYIVMDSDTVKFYVHFKCTGDIIVTDESYLQIEKGICPTEHINPYSAHDYEVRETMDAISGTTYNVNSAVMGRFSCATSNGIIYNRDNTYLGMDNVVPVESNTEYTISWNGISSNNDISVTVVQFKDDGTWTSASYSAQYNRSITTDVDTVSMYVHFHASSAISVASDAYLLINKGYLVRRYVPNFSAVDYEARLMIEDAYPNLPLYISIIDDDCKNNLFATRFHDACMHNGIRGAYAIQTDLLDSVGTSVETEEGTSISLLKGYELEGFSMLTHCSDQTSIYRVASDSDLVECYADFGNALRVMRDNGFITYNHFVIPYGTKNDGLRDMARFYDVKSAISIADGDWNSNEYINKYWIKRIGFNPDNSETVKSYIDNMVKEGSGWLVLGTHFCDDWSDEGGRWTDYTWDTSLDSNGYPVGYSIFNDLITYAKNKGCTFLPYTTAFAKYATGLRH